MGQGLTISRSKLYTDFLEKATMVEMEVLTYAEHKFGGYQGSLTMHGEHTKFLNAVG